MKRYLPLLALLALPSVAAAQTNFDLVSGVFRAAVTLSDLDWGGTRIDFKVQNTQGPGEAQAIVQGRFMIDGLFVDRPAFFDEYGAPGTLHGGAVLVGDPQTAVGAVWSATQGYVESGFIGFYDEIMFNVFVAGCTQIQGVSYPNGEVVYAGLVYGYVQTCGPDAYAEFTIDVPHVVGTAAFAASPRSYPAVVTPEPASLTLLATGLVGFAGVGSLKRSRREAQRSVAR